MSEPPAARYARAPDGTQIAYLQTGSGSPLVWLDMAPWHLRASTDFEPARSFYNALGTDRTLLRHDPRGFGLSDRTAQDFSLDTLVGDLAAVVDAAHLGRFQLAAVAQSGPIAIAFAARHPQRVSRLLLWSSFVRGDAVEDSGFLRTIRRFPPESWDMCVAVLAQVAVGWSDGVTPSLADLFATGSTWADGLLGDVAHFFAESTSYPTWQRFQLAANRHDATSDAATIAVPTRLVFPRAQRLLALDRPKGLTDAIPDAELVMLDGTSVLPYAADVDATLHAIVPFLDEPVDPP
jgi:pimeloyl-ACP methyl ester carboxylesterase